METNITPANNLSTFRTLHLVYGILIMFFSLFFLGYAFFGNFMFNQIPQEELNEMPFNPGIIFVIVGVIGFICCLTAGILNLLSSKYMNEQRNYSFVFAVAIVNCLTGILGILLGIFTLIEIGKPHVKALLKKS